MKRICSTLASWKMVTFGSEVLRLRDAEIQLEAEPPTPAKDPQGRGLRPECRGWRVDSPGYSIFIKPFVFFYWVESPSWTLTWVLCETRWEISKSTQIWAWAYATSDRSRRAESVSEQGSLRDLTKGGHTSVIPESRELSKKHLSESL